MSPSSQILSGGGYKGHWNIKYFPTLNSQDKIVSTKGSSKKKMFLH